MRKRKQSLFIGIIFLVLALGIGYAYLNTTLNISGTTDVDANTWNIYWDNVVVTTGSVTAETPEIDTNLTTVSFSVHLSKPGDFYEFTVDAVNDGSIDGMIDTITSKLNGIEISTTNPLPPYLNYIVTYSDGFAIDINHLLVANTIETYKVRVEYRTDISPSDLPENASTFTFGFGLSYIQADGNAINKPGWTLPDGKTASSLLLGDEICLENQCFNFIRYDGSNVVMLAKWNLNVGSYPKEAETFIQEEDVCGYKSGVSEKYGIVPFSKSYYWVNSSWQLKPEYGSSYPADVYDAVNYVGMVGTDTYSVAYYVEEYKTILINDYHAIIKEVRLLTYAEAVESNIGCQDTNNSCSTTGDSAFITNTSFWLGTSFYDAVWYIDATGSFNHARYDYDSDFGFGVRPVIVVSKNNL